MKDVMIDRQQSRPRTRTTAALWAEGEGVFFYMVGTGAGISATELQTKIKQGKPAAMHTRSVYFSARPCATRLLRVAWSTPHFSRLHDRFQLQRYRRNDELAPRRNSATDACFHHVIQADKLLQGTTVTQSCPNTTQSQSSGSPGQRLKRTYCKQTTK